MTSISPSTRAGLDLELPAHAHGDIFSFELTVGKQRIIVDAGVFEYNAGPARNWSRSTVAHNTVTLDSVDQCEFWSAFRMGHRANIKVLKSSFENSALIVEAEHDGYSKMDGNPVHRRRINVMPSGNISIDDQVMGGMGQQAISRLLLHPDVEIVEEGERHLLLKAGAAEIAIYFNGISPTIVDAYWWPDFGLQFNTKQVFFEYGSVPGKWHYQILIRNGHN